MVSAIRRLFFVISRGKMSKVPASVSILSGALRDVIAVIWKIAESDARGTTFLISLAAPAADTTNERRTR